MQKIVVEDPKKLQEKIVQNTKSHIYDSLPTNIQENRKKGGLSHICFFLPSTNQREGINC